MRLIVTIFLFVLTASSVTFALEEFKKMVPNGEVFPEVGHGSKATASYGRLKVADDDDDGNDNDGDGDEEGGALNVFGLDFASTFGSEPWLSECGRCGSGVSLCAYDSDGDGRTNGEELGDPCCQWRINTGATASAPLLTTGLSHPGVASSVNNAAAAAATIDCSAYETVLVDTVPSDAKRARGVIVAVSAWAFAMLVSVFVVRVVRKSSFAEAVRYGQIGPSFSVIVPDWIKAIDMFGIRDIIPEFLKLSFSQLFMIVFLLGGAIAALGVKYDEASDRNMNKGAQFAAAVGHFAEVMFTLTVLPISRNSLWIPLCGMSFERAIKFHRWSSRVAAVAVFVHGGMMVNSGFDATDSEAYSDNVGPIVLGLIAAILAAVIILTAVEPIRRRSYELFLFFHYPLTLGLLVVGSIHAPLMRWMLIFPAVLYVFDYAIRTYYGYFRKATVLSVASKGGVTQLEVGFEPGTYKHIPGGYAWVNFPAASMLEWHPFSVTYALSPERILLHIKNESGKFSSSLAAAMAPGASAHIDGVYGNPEVPIADYSNQLFVAGGIGATPMISLAQGSVAQNPRRNIVFALSVKSAANAAFFIPLVAKISEASARGGGKFRFMLFITGGKKPVANMRSVEYSDDDDYSSYDYTTSDNADGYSEDYESDDYSDYADDGAGKSFGESAPKAKGSADVLDLAADIGDIFYGRPGEQAVSAMSKLANGGKTAAYVCGPRLLLDNMSNSARSAGFFVHTESFEF